MRLDFSKKEDWKPNNQPKTPGSIGPGIPFETITTLYIESNWPGGVVRVSVRVLIIREVKRYEIDQRNMRSRIHHRCQL